MIKLNKVILILLALSSTILVNGQGNNNSQYSYFGFGDINNNGFTSSRGLGNSGIALRLPHQINYLNPASYTACDTMSFIFDFGLTGFVNKQISENGHLYGKTVNIDHLSVLFPVGKKAAISAGLVPFSSTGYFHENDILIRYDGSDEIGYKLKQVGAGGINKFYLGGSIISFDRLSLGVNGSYLFGTRTDQTIYDYSLLLKPFENYIFEEKHIVKDFTLDLGMQYSDTINENFKYCLGLTYGFGTELSTKYIRNILTQSNLEVVNTFDTDTMLSESRMKKSTLPSYIGAGLSVELYNRLILGGEYKAQFWGQGDGYKDLNLNGFTLTNSNEISAYVQYIPHPSSLANYFRRIQYRAGFHHENTSLTYGNEQIKDLGITFGLGLPLRSKEVLFMSGDQKVKNHSTINLSCDMGTRGTLNNNLIKENYLIFTLSLSLYDFWFYKSKYD